MSIKVKPFTKMAKVSVMDTFGQVLVANMKTTHIDLLIDVKYLHADSF